MFYIHIWRDILFPPLDYWSYEYRYLFLLLLFHSTSLRLSVSELSYTLFFYTPVPLVALFVSPFLIISPLNLLLRFWVKHMLQSMVFFASCLLEFKDILSLGFHNVWTLVINQSINHPLHSIEKFSFIIQSFQLTSEK